MDASDEADRALARELLDSVDEYSARRNPDSALRLARARQTLAEAVAPTPPEPT